MSRAQLGAAVAMNFARFVEVSLRNTLLIHFLELMLLLAEITL